jgi:hypothetical protein
MTQDEVEYLMQYENSDYFLQERDAMFTFRFTLLNEEEVHEITGTMEAVLAASVAMTSEIDNNWIILDANGELFADGFSYLEEAAA